jgi:hypothetical protein
MWIAMLRGKTGFLLATACAIFSSGVLLALDDGGGQGSSVAAKNADAAQNPSADFARQMLADAGTQASSATPAVRAKVWMELAKQCANDGDRGRERSLLGDAFQATLEIPPAHNNYYWVLQAETLRMLLKDFGPDAVEGLLPRMDENMRGLSFDMLLGRYVDDGNWDKSIDTVRRSPKSGWFPFVQADRLMGKLPAQRVGDRAVVFSIAYRICDGKHVAVSSLATMIEKFWRDLPPEEVGDAIPRILKEAMRAQLHPIMRPNHAYDDYKAKLLPILKQLDSAKTEQWERGEEAAMAEARKAGPMMTIAGGDDSQSAPQTTAQTPPPATNIRPTHASSKPRVVNQCMEDEAWCDENRVSHALEALVNHLKNGQLDLAKLSLNRGYKLALGEWRLDTDPDDPNQVHKPAWRSTQDWEAFTILATKISPRYALERVKEIPDPEIQLLTRVMLARMWLGNKPELTPCQELVSDYHQEGNCVRYYMYMPRALFSWANY